MKRIVTALFLLLSMLLCACAPQQSSEAAGKSETTAPENSTEDSVKPTAAPTTAPSKGQASERHKRRADTDTQLDELLAGQLKNRTAKLDVKELLQYPELPTGCESVALTAALRYLGFDLEKTEFASNWLSVSDDAMFGYMGDPFEDDGAGIFPPALAQDANQYLEAEHSDYVAVPTMGTELSDLYKLVDAGYPVLVWTTMYFVEPTLEDYGYFYDDEVYYWYLNEHCVVLMGYDLDEGTVTVCDPLSGIVECDAEEFQYIYDTIGQMSMTIIK